MNNNKNSLCSFAIWICAIWKMFCIFYECKRNNDLTRSYTLFILHCKKFFGNFSENSRTLSKSESVKFSQIEWVICLFTDSPVKKYISLFNQLIVTDWISGKKISLLNQLIFIEAISGIWLIYSNLFVAIWISQISLIISRFWLIHI